MEKRLVGGALLVISFAAIIGQALLFLLDWESIQEGLESELGGFIVIALYGALIQVILSAVVVTGALSALLGKSLVISILGSVAGMMGGGILFIGTISSLAALPFIIWGRKGFESERKRPQVSDHMGGFVRPQPDQHQPQLHLYSHSEQTTLASPPNREHQEP